MSPELKAQKLVDRFGYMAEACVEEIISELHVFSYAAKRDRVIYWNKVLDILKSK